MASISTEKPHLDRLSNLHDTLLGNILSRLSIKDVVRTSVLSKHWRRKWTLIAYYILDTDFDTWGTPWEGVFSFMDFLNEILRNHQHLRRFRATFWPAMSGWVQDSVNAVLTHNNLEYLDVNTNSNDLAFPPCLLNSGSLRELKVVQPVPCVVRVIVDPKNCAPNLTSLSLYNVAFENQSGIVSFEFPALEKLELRMISFSFQTSSVEIYAPLLTSFSCEPLVSPSDSPPIKIVAPRLKELSCGSGLPGNLVLDWSSVFSVAFLDAVDARGYWITPRMPPAKLLTRFTHLEDLMLSFCMTQLLRRRNGPPLHQSDRLKRHTLLSGSDADRLFELLHETPSLKFVSVNVDEWEDFDYEAIDTPSCIASHIEEVVLQDFSGEVAQYNLAEYLLKTSKKLKKFTITTKHIGPSEEMKRVLSAFYRCSPSLEIFSRLPDMEPIYTHFSIFGT